MALHLYELAAQIREAIRPEDINEETGEIAPEAIARLDALNMDFDTKVEACCAYAKELRATRDATDAELKRLKKTAHAADASWEHMKSYIFQQMQGAGKEKAGGLVHKAGIQKGQEALDVFDEGKVPASYFVPQPPVLDKARLKADMQAGVVKIDPAVAVLRRSPFIVIR